MRTINVEQGVVSADETISLPDEIHVYDNGQVVAVHASSGDFEYATIADLIAAYHLQCPACTLRDGPVESTTDTENLWAQFPEVFCAECSVLEKNELMLLRRDDEETKKLWIVQENDKRYRVQVTGKTEVCLCDLDGEVINRSTEWDVPETVPQWVRYAVFNGWNADVE